MKVFLRWVAVAGMVALLGGASSYRGPRFQDGVRVPLDPSGIIKLGLEVGPMTFHELFVQDAPTDPARIAALPRDKALKPRPFIVATNGGKEEVLMQFTFAFEDADGKVLFDCVHHDVDQEEESKNEISQVCVPGIVGTLTPDEWARVTTVHLEVSLQQKK